MVQTKWILSLLFLPMLQFEAAITTRTRYLVQEHSRITFPCKTVEQGLEQCKGTTWLFISEPANAAVELIELGKIRELGNRKSDRLDFTEDCSLVIMNVTAQDAGSYTCQQWSETKGSTTNTKLAEDSVDLSVIIMTEQWKKDMLILNCKVLPLQGCPYTVKWQLGGSDIKGNIADVWTSTSSCSSSVRVWRPCDESRSKFQSLRCGVAARSDQPNQENFNPPSVCTTAGEKESVTSPSWAETTTSTETPTKAGQNQNHLWLFYAGGAAFFAAVVAAVVIGWTIKRRRKEKTDVAADGPEEVLSYATISFTQNSTDKNLHHEDVVTYSTVRDTSSSCPPAHNGPDMVYAQINKPHWKQ